MNTIQKAFDSLVESTHKHKNIRKEMVAQLEGFTHGIMFCNGLEPGQYQGMLNTLTEIKNQYRDEL